jgi:hypothetical protein
MNRLVLLGNLTVMALIGAATPVVAGQTLVINGTTASTDVRTIDGSAYVRISDVAKALGMVVVKRGNGYEIIKSGGANQIPGVTQGKVGDVLFDGRWRFQVVSVETPDSYTLTAPDVEPLYGADDVSSYNSATRVVRAKPGYKLVLVRCRMINGQKSTQTFWLGHQDVNNALADEAGESHPPIAYDLMGSPIQSKPLLPGAKTEVPILFSVPQATTIKDLVFTLRNNDFSQKGNDVRVSLKPGQN